MGMYGVFALAKDDEIQTLLARPETAIDFLDRLEDDDELPRELNVEKSWHAIHWLLTGSEWEGEPPLNFIVAGGIEVGDRESVGYGPARAFTSDMVMRIHEALAPISVTELIGRYDGNAMRDLYPEVWNRPDEQEINRQEIASNFEALKGYIAHGAALGYGMLVYVT